MADSLSASESGRAQVDQARRKKGWTKDAAAWIDRANELLKSTGDSISRSRMQRFWKGDRIRQAGFVAICQAVGIDDWETIADLSVPNDSSSASSPHFSSYKPQTWAGRSQEIAHLTAMLTNGCRLLILHGLTGIGKTTLAERLAVDLVGIRCYVSVVLDREVGSADFTRGAIAILAAMKDETGQKLPDDQILPYLLKTLTQTPCWLQLDSLECLLHQTEAGEAHFIDRAWADFFCDFLAADTASQIVITAQALPANIQERCDRLTNRWHEYYVRGLEKPFWLDLFRNYGVAPQSVMDETHLCTIAAHFEGHPLILKMIAGDIGKPLFGGNISKYWREYYSQRIRPKLHQSKEEQARQWVKQTLKQLPDLPNQMLQRCAVFRRAVPEAFYLRMLEGVAASECNAALMLLKSRYLVEEADIQAGQIFVRQHNLIRDVAYELLKTDTSKWETAERQAAHLWLIAYESALNVPNLETLRGYLEAFEHYCNIEDWEAAKALFTQTIDTPAKSTLSQQLDTWGYFQEEIRLAQKLLKKCGLNVDLKCWKSIGNGYIDLGNYSEAIKAYRSSLKIAREIDDRADEGRILSNLGLTHHYLGQYDQAIDFLQQAVIISQKIGDRQGEGNSLGNLGLVYDSLKQYEQAICFQRRSLVVFREIGDHRGESNSLGNLGLVYDSLKQYEQAIDFHQQALAISREIGDPYSKGQDLRGLGSAQVKIELYSEALENLCVALEIFREIGTQKEEAQALANLAELHQALGEVEVAQQYCQQALALATELGIPLAAECEALQLKIENEQSSLATEESRT